MAQRHEISECFLAQCKDHYDIKICSLLTVLISVVFDWCTCNLSIAFFINLFCYQCDDAQCDKNCTADLIRIRIRAKATLAGKTINLPETLRLIRFLMILGEVSNNYYKRCLVSSDSRIHTNVCDCT